ncbi:hypothetical protein BLNAU_21098 [Blattamonas nauphoetae]|uniref:Uncharacterized protein n=1 Tax=Blattamonas nauphoetae TaxID=2049346 RepID=A0ABQ9WWQ9_9EUKA|nr:hypothetical protein BLNAU_21098 [Blattamonas nauphoetae]
MESLFSDHEACKDCVSDAWGFFVDLNTAKADPHKSSFKSIILDDPSFPDLVIQSLKLESRLFTKDVVKALVHISIGFPEMRERWRSDDLVRRMFETVDFVSLPQFDAGTHLRLTHFIVLIVDTLEEDNEAYFHHIQLVRVSVFEPTKPFAIFIFHNWNRLRLGDVDRTELECHLSKVHAHIKNMELLSDEHDADIVSELVKCEAGQMIVMENERHFEHIFETILIRTLLWDREKPERQKRREVLLREEGWDDAFELRVVGIEEG